MNFVDRFRVDDVVFAGIFVKLATAGHRGKGILIKSFDIINPLKIWLNLWDKTFV